MLASYATEYQRLYESHWWWRSREQFLVRIVETLVARGGQAEILDVGCGSGWFFPRLSEFGDVFGVEPDPLLLSPESPWVERISAVPFDESYRPQRRFDLILFADVLEHLDEPAAALRRALELLRPGGRILVTVPAFRALWTRHDDLNHHRERFSRASFAKLAVRSGARVTDSRYFFAWLALAKLGLRALEAVTRASARAPGVPALAINATLTRISLAEHAIARRLRLPFGSSLLAVLERAH